MAQRGRISAASLAVVHSPEPVEPAQSSPKPPASLGEAGTGLWTRIQAGYQLTAGEGEILGLACASIDTAVQLEAEIEADGVVIRTQRDPRDHPVLKHLTQARALTARLLSRLGVAP